MLNRINNAKNSIVKFITDAEKAFAENPRFVVTGMMAGSISGFCYGIYVVINWDDGSPSREEIDLMKLAAVENIGATYNCTYVIPRHYRALSLAYSKTSLTCASIYNQSSAYASLAKEFRNIDDLYPTGKMILLSIACPVSFLALGGITGFYSAVCAVNAKIAIQNHNNPQLISMNPEARKKKQAALEKLINKTGLSPIEADALLNIGMRVWLLQAATFTKEFNIPLDIFVYITTFIAGQTLSLDQINNMKYASSKQLFTRIKEVNLNKYNLMLFSNKPQENDNIYKNEDGKARSRFNARKKSLRS